MRIGTLHTPVTPIPEDSPATDASPTPITVRDHLECQLTAAFGSTAREHLPTELLILPQLQLSGPETRELQQRLSSAAPQTAADLSPALLHKLHGALAEPYRRILHSPHPGIDVCIFDLRRALRPSDGERSALDTYLRADFAFLDTAQKAEILAQLAPLLDPRAAPWANFFHLPQRRGNATLTLSLEAESTFHAQPTLLDVYGPDPQGRLDPHVVDALAGELESTPTLLRGPAALRIRASDHAGLMWRDLSLAGRLRYVYWQEKVTPDAYLYRLADPKQTLAGQVLPASLRSQLSWEGPPGRRYPEIRTNTHYESLDQLSRDLQCINDIDTQPKRRPGFHVHNVIELPRPEDVRRDGPAIVAYIALQDLQLFATQMVAGANALTSTHLEVWKASGINDVATSLASGSIDPDAIMVHKFHSVGLRTGAIYGGGPKLGYEIRGVLVGRVEELRHRVERGADIVTQGKMHHLPRPPWAWWNAGDPQLPDDAFLQAKQNPKFQELTENLAVTFADLFDTAISAKGKTESFRLASPFWNFEALPGITDRGRQDIRAARETFTAGCLQLCRNFADVLASPDTNVDANALFTQIQGLAMDFFREARIAAYLERYLNGVRAMEPA